MICHSSRRAGIQKLKNKQQKDLLIFLFISGSQIKVWDDKYFMLLIVGLGNPGKEYEKTRHNAGWLFLDYLKSLPESDFDGWKEKKKLNALITEGVLTCSPAHLLTKVILAKPLTFMNDSGVAVSKLATSYKLSRQSGIPQSFRNKNQSAGQATSSLVVAHDDIDIPFGEFKIQTNRGAAGHHGVESIIEHLGTKDFSRIRVGIRPSSFAKAMDHVLKMFSKDELKTLNQLFQTITSELLKSVP